jgi:hypothetical protein
MWKHEILNRFSYSPYLNDKCINELNKILNQSITFYCGDIEKIYSENFIKENQIIFDNISSIKLPYDPILFEFKDTPCKEKTALLCGMDNRDRISIFIFANHNNQGWDMIPLMHEVEARDNKGYFYSTFLYKELEPEWKDALLHHSKYYEGGIYAILLLLNCKNIEKKENKPPEKLNKKRIKNGKLPLFSYYTLHIKDSENSNSENILGDHNRIHLCRGHFKHYTQENPLFGKLTGMYWWQPHVRGQNKDGIIMKDYSVDASNPI